MGSGGYGVRGWVGGGGGWVVYGALYLTFARGGFIRSVRYALCGGLAYLVPSCGFGACRVCCSYSLYRPVLS